MFLPNQPESCQSRQVALEYGAGVDVGPTGDARARFGFDPAQERVQALLQDGVVVATARVAGECA